MCKLNAWCVFKPIWLTSGVLHVSYSVIASDHIIFDFQKKQPMKTRSENVFL